MNAEELESIRSPIGGDLYHILKEKDDIARRLNNMIMSLEQLKAVVRKEEACCLKYAMKERADTLAAVLYQLEHVRC